MLAGFAPVGEGAKLAASGETGINGKIPVNTGGGLIGFGHPVGATGVKQAVEIYRQMKGECGENSSKYTKIWSHNQYGW